MPARSENLTCEFGDRGFTAGASDGHHSFRLRAIVAGRQHCQRTARLNGQQHGHLEAGWNFSVFARDNGHSTLGHGIGNELAAVGLGARHSGENESGLHLAAVGGQSGNGSIAHAPQLRGVYFYEF